MRRQLLHPGTILGMIALIVALSGSVYAASSIPEASVTSVQVKDGSIALKDLSSTARRTLRGARGAKGLAGATGATGASGAAGAAGAQGPAGTARAFGLVSSAGIVNAARSKNITATKLPTTGLYCVKPTAASGIDLATTVPVLTPDFSDGSGSLHVVQFQLAASDCVGGWAVITNNFSAGTFALTDIAFSIVIP